MQQRYLIGTLLILATTLAGLHAAALELGWYWYYTWFDVAVHLLGGVVVALFVLFLFNAVLSKAYQNESIGFVIALLVTGTAAVGLGWEILEQQLRLTWDAGFSIATAKDLVVDIAGALLVAAGVWWRRL